MPWNPETYNKFKTERFQPFYDCLSLIKVKTGMEVIDLGCGTGELTHKLATHLPDPARIIGIDSSPEMLVETKRFNHPALQFRSDSIEDQINHSQNWDLIFSNAAIQWVDNHKSLLPQLISKIKPGGQLVIQIPSQHHNISNLILADLAGSGPFNKSLDQWIRPTPVLEPEQYAKILFDNSGDQVTVFEKIYPIIVRDFNGLYEWVSGTALLPYTDRLNASERDLFIAEFKKRLEQQFPGEPVFYPFKRIIMSAIFGAV